MIMECYGCVKEFQIDTIDKEGLTEEFWQLTEDSYKLVEEGENFERITFYCSKCLDFMIEDEKTLNQIGQENLEYLE